MKESVLRRYLFGSRIFAKGLLLSRQIANHTKLQFNRIAGISVSKLLSAVATLNTEFTLCLIHCLRIVLLIFS